MVSKRLITILTPVNPIPTNMPALNDFPIESLNTTPTTKKIIGIITAAPKLTIA
ncbi:hypothetical protein LR1_00350 [Lacticaseibacillus rhamnosus DSM 20021 = JCM 1136 = NBRC 3425]|nr:hypothetical protein LR1_00350 [Lacticaseibacillus rhamnosus DSM 20021 = JCM 1136 = NBRC 3425]